MISTSIILNLCLNNDVCKQIIYLNISVAKKAKRNIIWQSGQFFDFPNCVYFEIFVFPSEKHIIQNMQKALTPPET